jgi:hypothetical protein
MQNLYIKGLNMKIVPAITPCFDFGPCKIKSLILVPAKFQIF